MDERTQDWEAVWGHGKRGDGEGDNFTRNSCFASYENEPQFPPMKQRCWCLFCWTVAKIRKKFRILDVKRSKFKEKGIADSQDQEKSWSTYIYKIPSLYLKWALNQSLNLKKQRRRANEWVVKFPICETNMQHCRIRPSFLNSALIPQSPWYQQRALHTGQ